MVANKDKKNRRALYIGLGVLAVLVIAALAGYGMMKQAPRGYKYTDEVRLIKDTDQGIGDVEVSTLKLDEGFALQRASYGFSGRVLLTYNDGSETVFCSMNDDGTGMHEIWRGSDNGGNRILPYWDNRRVLVGDYVLECPEGYTLDNCPEGSGVMVPIIFPDEFIKDPQVSEPWTEVIISPDGEYLAMTIRRNDCGAANAMGHMVRTDKGYELRDTKYISNLNTFRPDPEHEGLSIHGQVIGGEVKQFVRGGKEISLVGAGPNGMGNSVTQDVATGEVKLVTNTPGYDETTIFSPDERLGMVMSTRFSEATDMGVLGLVPRPYGEVLHNIMGQIYMYSVIGVRRVRPGNIGPAMINIEMSQHDADYRGINLSDPDGVWVFNSPMSWKADGTAAMWMEREREGNGVRVRIAKLKDYTPGPVVAAVATPAVGDYAMEPTKLENYDAKVQGAVSGFVTVKKETAAGNKTTVTMVYDNYSDDGEVFYNGTEVSSGSLASETSYTSDLVVTDANGKKLGGMDVKLLLSASYSMASAIGGVTGPTLIKESSSGSAVWGSKTRRVEDMLP